MREDDAHTGHLDGLLKPCPICGCLKYVYRYFYDGLAGVFFSSVDCSWCGLEMTKCSQDSWEQADIWLIRTWNTRIPSEAKADPLPVVFKFLGNRPFRFKLKTPITATVLKEDGLVFCTYKPFNIEAWGDSVPEAIDVFHSDFDHLWQYIVLERDEKLTGDAIALKSTIKEAVIIPENMPI